MVTSGREGVPVDVLVGSVPSVTVLVFVLEGEERQRESVEVAVSVEV